MPALPCNLSNIKIEENNDSGYRPPHQLTSNLNKNSKI